MKRGRLLLKSGLFRFSCGAVALLAMLTIVYFPKAQDPPHIPPDVIEHNRQAYVATWSNKTVKVNPEDKDFQRVSEFISEYRLQEAKVLEVGAGTGRLQDIVQDYTGLDISESSAQHFHKPFVQASATAMPFPDHSFDVVWTINVIEHVPHPEHALSEIRRVLRNGGYLYLSPAWQCRSWAARGYQVRPWSDFDFKGKVVKASIPVRDSIAYRSLYTLPIRLLRSPMQVMGPTKFRYNTVVPNYEIGERFWQSDSDAVNSMDAYEAIMWFTSRGDECLNYQGFIRQVSVRNGPIIFKIAKNN